MARPSNRERILDSLEELIRARGTAGTSIEAVAKHAGVSKGGLLYHFPSRIELIEGFTSRLLERIDAAVEEAPSDPVAVIRWYLEPVPTATVDRIAWTSFITALHTTDEGTGEAIAEAIRRWSTPLEVLGPRLAEHVRLLGDGLFLNALLGIDLPDRQRLEAVIDDLIDGIGRTEP